MKRTFKTEGGRRFDEELAKSLDITRAQAKKLIDSGQALLDDTVQKAGANTRKGQVIELHITEHPTVDDLPVIYEDDDCIVINKPAGLLAHSKGEFNPEPTVASILRSKIDPSLIGNRAGIVHRLDRLTSGVMIVAKNTRAQKILQSRFAERKVSKGYVAVCSKMPEKNPGIIDIPIARNPKKPATFMVGKDGRQAQTSYKAKLSGSKAFFCLQPKTGRTHQLRVHLAHIGCPIDGDELYGGAVADRLYLHAHTLALQLVNGKDGRFVASIPEGFPEL